MAKSTAARAEARFKQLCCLGLGGEAVMPALVDELRAIIPSYGSSVFFLDEAGALVNIYDQNPETPHVAPLYLGEFHNRPQRELGTGFGDALRHRYGVQTLEEILTVDVKTFSKSDYYNLLWRPLGYHSAMRLAFWDGNRPVGGVMLARSSGEPQFSEDEKRRLAILGTFFALAMTGRDAIDGPVADSGRHGLIIADVEGTPIFSSAEGRRLLFFATHSRTLPGSHNDNLVLPPALVRICRGLAGVFASDPTAPVPVHHHRNVWGSFRFAAHWLGGWHSPQDVVGITIAHEEPLPVQLVRRLGDLPLSPRQAEICVMLATGLTNEAIAERLGISRHTAIAPRPMDLQPPGRSQPDGIGERNPVVQSAALRRSFRSGAARRNLLPCRLNRPHLIC